MNADFADLMVHLRSSAYISVLIFPFLRLELL
jgi:hypothetical protein